MLVACSSMAMTEVVNKTIQEIIELNRNYRRERHNRRSIFLMIEINWKCEKMNRTEQGVNDVTLDITTKTWCRLFSVKLLNGR